MTTRQRTVISVAAQADARVQREAAANGEQAHEATREAVRRAVEDAASADPRAHEFNARRFVAEAVRQVEDFEGVRRGWWS